MTRRFLAAGFAVLVALVAGCNMISEQANASAPFIPTNTLFSGGSVVGIAEQVSPATLQGFANHVGHIQGLEDFALVGDFTEGGGLAPSPPPGVDVEAYFTTNPAVDSAYAGQHRVLLWGPIHIAEASTRRVLWSESVRLTGPGKRDLASALMSGTPFTIAIVRTSATGSIAYSNIEIAAVLDVGP